jgi:PAS domain S-box-containing protein
MAPENKQRILVVDDSEPGRYATSRLLRQAGFDIIEAGTGRDALKRVTEDHPDLVLLDVRLPDINGVEVCGRIKAAPETASIPVLQMSASVVDATSKVAALEGGADAYISTPIEPAVMVATVRALLRLRAAEQAVRDAAVEWQATFDGIGDGIGLLDVRGRVQRSNAALPMLLGRNPDEVTGRDLDELIPPGAGDEAIAKGLEKLKRFKVERAMGERTFAITVDPMVDPAGKLRGGVAIVTDITERKRMDQRLWEAQKMESIGLLAGGVAHDFNNLLMGILGNASLASETLQSPKKARAALQDVVRASERAAALTRQLLAYAGKGHFVVGPVDLSSMVQELAPLIQSSIPRKVGLVLNVAADLPGIEADKAQLEQVAMNLIVNAAEAIENEGSVTVTTRIRRVDPADRLHFVTDQDLEGCYIALEVRDNGVGMDEETRRRIFDPFFSTKFLGRGLGLSAALGIVRRHRGAIRVESEPGKGTAVEVLFPARAEVPIPAEIEKPAAAPGKGTILVVDDEEMIRTLLVATLERSGYQVLLAENGAEALSVFSRNAERISLVVLDLVMPVMSGDEVLPHLFLYKPQIPVIVSSGQDPSECMRKLSEPRVASYLQKPYRPDKLIGKIHDLLADK